MIDILIPSDLNVMGFLLLISFIISIVIGIIFKKRQLATISFSILGNISFFLNIGSDIFYIHNLIWLKYIIIFIWPTLNLYLLIKYFLKK